MLKRLLPPFLVLAGAFLLAPNALAVCYRCKTFPPDPCPHCQIFTGTNRFAECRENVFECTCLAEGECTSLSARAATPALASEYTVAAVERLDEVQQSPVVGGEGRFIARKN